MLKIVLAEKPATDPMLCRYLPAGAAATVAISSGCSRSLARLLALALGFDQCGVEEKCHTHPDRLVSVV